MIDWKRFDWEEIFGSVASTSGLKRKQTRALRTEVQEIATSKYSDGQLKYVGDKEDGKDYIDCDGSSVEDKAQEGMFCKTTGRTKVFILKRPVMPLTALKYPMTGSSWKVPGPVRKSTSCPMTL